MSTDASSSSAANSAGSSEARELSLVSKVELRIALADSDEKLQRLLQTYLAPLLLKLASESLAVRNKVIAVCHHINTRIQPQSIQLPVPALLKQFKEQKSQLIRHFDLIYIQRGIDRLDPSARVELLPAVLEGVSQLETTSDQAASVFNLVLRLLPLLKLPKKDSPEDVGLKEKLALSVEDTRFLSSWFAKLFLLSPGGKDARTCPGLAPSEYRFLNKASYPEETWDPAKKGGLNLTETKVAVARFLASGAFTNSERFLPAVIASTDANSRLAEIGDDILKRFTPDLEDPDVVEQLYRLYFGTEGDDAAPPVRTALQVKILGLLGRSVKATTYTDRIIRLLDEGLFSDAAKSAQGLQASKLRSQIFTFTTWVVRMGAPSDLELIAPKAITGLREFVESQGWPDPGVSGQKFSHADLGLRGLAYESIGILAPKLARKTAAGDSDDGLDMDLLIWLFKSLGSDASGPEIFVSIEQALGSILSSFTGTSSEDMQQQLRTFLMSQMTTRPGEDDPSTGFKIVRSTRFAAVRFANRCLPYSDSIARWIDLVAVGTGVDGQREIVEEGKKGLHPYWYRLLNPSKDGIGTVSTSTDVEQNPRYEFPRFQDLPVVFGMFPQSVHAQLAPAEYVGAFAPAVRFHRHLLIWEAFSRAQIPVQIDQEWEHRLDTLLRSDEPARFALREYIRHHTEHDVIRLFLDSALDGLLSKKGTAATDCGTDFVDVSSLTPNEILSSLVNRAPSLLDRIYSTNDHATQHVAARAFGILASHASLPEDECRRFQTELVRRVASWQDAFGQVANQVRGALLAAAYLLVRLAYRRRLQVIPDTQVRQYISTVVEVLANSRYSQLREAAQLAIGQFSLAEIQNPTIISEISDWKTVKDKLVEHAKKEQETAIRTLGQMSLIMPKDGDNISTFDEIMTALYNLHEIRKPEVQFTVGESLSTAAAGWKSKSLIGEFDVDETPLETNVPETVLSDMVDKLIEGCGASKPSLRKASAIWLLCLVKDCGQLDAVQTRLRKCQAAFTGLLADRDEVVQESGSRGLTLVYEMGDQDLRDDLVRDLVRSFTGNTPNLGGGKISEETELFEPGVLPTGEGSSITTYRDIMNLASEVGDPSLVYRFMSLASNNAIWSSRAAFGRFGLSSVLSDSSVNGYLARNPKIYPKLYRYRFDPNPNVQRSMNDIWRALVKDPNAVLDAHFDDIMEDLLQSVLAGREWRVRQASCAAIADLIQGRPLEKYDKYMGEILTKAFKVLDDIKESVRVAALRLCQTITNMLIRTLETGDTGSKRAKAMLAHIVPFLLSQEGMESSVQEVQAYAITTLIQIIKKGSGVMLRPFVPQILEKFVASLSSLEPQAVNYIHLNADKYGLTGQEIDKMRLSSIRMSPMMESIERYLLDALDEASMKEVADKLDGVLRTAVGLPSKVGCSRVLVLLSTRSLLFRPYADRFIQLLKKYVLDRNDTVSVSYSTAIGYLVRLASDERVLDTLKFAESLYFTAEETHHRVVSGEILHSMSKLSSDRFAAFAAAALPFVFVAKHDTDEQVREPFDKTWQDNVGGPRSVALYLKEILSLISEHLDSPRWAIKHTAALACADAIMCLDKTIDRSTGELVWPVLEKALAGKTWDGKESVLKAFVRFSESAKATWQAREDIRAQMKVRTASTKQSAQNVWMTNYHSA